MEELNNVGPPPEWKNDETMAVLFAPFRINRNVNPNSWDRKLHFWNQCILRRCQSGGNAVINAKELPKKFERKGKVPYCLGIVVQDMMKKGVIQTYADTITSLTGNQTWSAWTFNLLVKRPVQVSFDFFIKKPILWGYSRIFSSGDDGMMHAIPTAGDSTIGLPDQQFVVLEVVKYLGDLIQKSQSIQALDTTPTRMVTLSELRQRCMKCCPHEDSFQLAMMWLCHQRRCVITDMGNEKVVVFAGFDQDIVEPPTEAEITVYKLNLSKAELHEHIDKLQKEMESLRLDAKSYLQRGMNTSAKNCLRRKKRLQLQQDKKEAAIENIHQLLCTIKQTDSDKQVLDAYSSGVAAYKDMTKKYGLTTDAVDDVMVGIQEVLDTQDDLNRSLAMPLSPDDMTSDDLERELEDILDSTLDLPNIPQGEPQPIPQREPHQDMINTLCQMRLGEHDELPDVPSHPPGGSALSYSPVHPPVGVAAGPQPVALAASPGKHQPATSDFQPLAFNNPTSSDPVREGNQALLG